MIRGVWGVLIVCAMDFRIVALPSVCGVLVVVWQGILLILADLFLFSNCSDVSFSLTMIHEID